MLLTGGYGLNGNGSEQRGVFLFSLRLCELALHPACCVFARGFENPVLCKKGGILFDMIKLEAATGFEPVIRVLQTLALPLGHAAELGYAQ